jgi:hypothetical protein
MIFNLCSYQCVWYAKLYLCYMNSSCKQFLVNLHIVLLSPCFEILAMKALDPLHRKSPPFLNSVFQNTFVIPVKKKVNSTTCKSRLLSHMKPKRRHYQNEWRPSHFWNVARRMFVVDYRRFGASYLSRIQWSRNPRI